MNWFERYGIVGIYFVTMSFIWLRIFSGNWLMEGQSLAIGAGISLPAGYLISILAQNIYYSLPEKWQVHKTACKEIESIPKKKEKELESYLAIRYRLHTNPKKLDNVKWLQDYIRKRWDVFAISASMILATALAFITPVLLLLIGIITYTPKNECSKLWLILWLILSLIIIVILLWSRQLMFSQIVEVYKDVFDEQKENLQSDCPNCLNYNKP